MSDRRRRFRRNRPSHHDDFQPRPIIIAKREEDRPDRSNIIPTQLQKSTKTIEIERQTKILLKANDDDAPCTSAEAATANATYQAPVKTMVITRSDLVSSPVRTSSPNMTVEQQAYHQQQQQQQQQHNQCNTLQPMQMSSTTASQLIEPVPLMTRPATIISSTGILNSSAKKLLKTTNNDFLVVGVIGMQGVGKSTILNLLAYEDFDNNFYEKIFIKEECIFPTKLKLQKCTTRSRTESTHMFIRPERIILLDSPPVLCNSYKKDVIMNEIDDYRNVINFLTVCHLLIVVQEDYNNLNFMRALQLALLMKPPNEHRNSENDYFPNFLFIKNRAQRIDFLPKCQERFNKLVRLFFKRSTGPKNVAKALDQLRLQYQNKIPDFPPSDLIFGTFLIPDFEGPEATSYHASLVDIIKNLRLKVFSSPRKKISDENNFTESMWFEMLSNVSQGSQVFFFQVFEDMHRRRFDDLINSGVGDCIGGSSGTGTGNTGNTGTNNATGGDFNLACSSASADNGDDAAEICSNTSTKKINLYDSWRF